MQLRNQIIMVLLVVAFFTIRWLQRHNNQPGSSAVPSQAMKSGINAMSRPSDGLIYGGGRGDGPEVDFSIDNVRQHQSFHSDVPYVRNGGDWTFFDCSVTNDPRAVFTFGFETPSKRSQMFSFGAR